MLDNKGYRHLLTYSMEQSPSWQANWFSAGQEIPRILFNPKLQYRIHKCPPPVPILSQLDPVNTPTSHFLKIYLNIILHLRLGLPSGLFPQVFPPKPCTQATDTHWQYVTLTAFPLQQWSHVRTSVLRHTCIACLVAYGIIHFTCLFSSGLPLLRFWKRNHLPLCSTCSAHRILIALAINAIISDA